MSGSYRVKADDMRQCGVCVCVRVCVCVCVRTNFIPVRVGKTLNRILLSDTVALNLNPGQ